MTKFSGRIQPPDSLMDQSVIAFTYDKYADEVTLLLTDRRSFRLGGLSGEYFTHDEFFQVERYLLRALGGRRDVVNAIFGTLFAWRACVVDVNTGRVTNMADNSPRTSDVAFTRRALEDGHLSEPSPSDGDSAFIYIEGVASGSLLAGQHAPVSRNPRRVLPR